MPSAIASAACGARLPCRWWWAAWWPAVGHGHCLAVWRFHGKHGLPGTQVGHHPIALPLAERFGGLPSLAAVAVAITGIAGTIVAPWLLRVLHCTDPAVEGFALGLTAHAIGTARSIQQHPTAGAFAALAMGLNGVATAVAMPLLMALL
jgi:hypothetical protein